jgi:phosphomannomutase
VTNLQKIIQPFSLIVKQYEGQCYNNFMEGVTPKVVIFDLDGTLTESKAAMTAVMGQLLARLLEKTVVAVMSGGSWAQFQKQFLIDFPPETKFDRLYLFPDSAAMCFVHRNREWQPQYNNSFDPATKQRILDALRDSIIEVHFEQPPKLWGEQTEDRGAQITFSALGQQAPLEEKKRWDPTREKRKPLFEALKRRLPDLSIGLNATTTIDITPHGINKAYGITRLSELTGIPIDQMLYVGDALGEGGNDSVVIPTGVPTHAVSGPAETAALIEELLKPTGAVA